jgi:hypothetical protein
MQDPVTAAAVSRFPNPLALSPTCSSTQLFEVFELCSLSEPARALCGYSLERCRLSRNCYENCYENCRPSSCGGCGMNSDLAARAVDSAELLTFQIGQWEHLEYPENAPPLGQRNADAIIAGHAAIRTIDKMIRSLHELRGQLTAELREDEDIRGQRIDRMVAECRDAKLRP